jgi:hypothetical protein
MDRQECGKKWVGDDSQEAEAAFHETLLRLRAKGASNQEIAEAVMRSPFILGLVWIVTAKKRLHSDKGARTPLDWDERLAQEPELRDEWRGETLYLLGKRLRKRWDERCDLQRLRIGGYWRVKIIYAAIKAAWNLHEEGRLKVRRGRASVQCFGDGMPFFEDRKPWEGSTDRAIDVKLAINELENDRQREVMRLSLADYTYREISDILSEANGPDGHKVTYEMVRGAFEKAREVMKKMLRLPATA